MRGPEHAKPSTHRIGDGLDDDRDSELVLAALKGREPAAPAWLPVLVRPDGSVVVDQRAAASWRRISGNGTTTLKSGPGTLRRVVISSGTSASVTLYDSLTGSGSVIAPLPVGSTGERPNSIEFGVPFTTGLTAVTAGGPDVTVVWD